MTSALTAVAPNNLIQPLSDTLQSFKDGVDALLAKRKYFIQQVMPSFIENRDYYEIKGKKSLGKAGAEKLASIYNLTATFEQDHETMSAFNKLPGLIVFVCTLYRGNNIVGQGRGASTLDRNQGDANKTLKMAQKSAFIDGIIRSTGLSEAFSQDLEIMAGIDVIDHSEAPNSTKGHNVQLNDDVPLIATPFLPETTSTNQPAEEISEDYGFIPATDKQKTYLFRLASQKCFEPEELEERFKIIEGLSKKEASDSIKELLNTNL